MILCHCACNEYSASKAITFSLTYLIFNIIFFLQELGAVFWLVQWSTIANLISCKWGPLGPHRALMTTVPISFTLSFHPSTDICVPYSAFYYLSPCVCFFFISAPLSWSSGWDFFFSQRCFLCFVVYIWSPRMNKAWGRKTMLSALTHLADRHWGIRHRQRRESISSDTVTLCRNLRESETAVTRLVVSSTAYDYDSSW